MDTAFYEYLRSVDFTVSETTLASHIHYLHQADEALMWLKKIIRANEGVSFRGGGHFTEQELATLYAAARIVDMAAVPRALFSVKAGRPILLPKRR